MLALGYVLFVASSTAMPSGRDAWVPLLDLNQLVTPRFVGKLVVVAALAGGLALAALVWRRRQIWTARLSLPLVVYLAVCGAGLAMLVLISQPPRYLARVGLEDLHHVAQDFDVRHMITYFGFAVVVAIAWRRRVSLPVLGALLMAYGYGLELLQELVPTREFRAKDLVSNALGILLGMCWVYLYDSLLDPRGTALSRRGERRRRRARAKAPGAHATVEPRRS